MKKGLICLLVLFVCAGSAFSCKGKGEETAPVSIAPPPDNSGESAEPTALPITEGKKEDSMIVSVNGTIITQSEVDRQMDYLMQQFGGKVPPEQLKEMRPTMLKQALDNLINHRILIQEAERKGIEADKKTIDERIAEIKDRFPEPEKFQEQLTGMGLSEQQFHEEIEQNLKLESLLDSQTEDFKEAGQDEIEEFYRSNPESFRKPERVQASHILLKVDTDANDETRSQKRLELASLRGKIEKGAEFAQLASEHSECPSSSRGGDLGHFESGKMVKPFEEAAFGMKVGEVSEIVETQFGYHLIKVTDRQDAEAVPLDKVRDKIVSFLNRQKKDQAVSDYLDKLRGTTKIEYAEGYQP